MIELTAAGDFIGGEFVVPPNPTGEIRRESPGDRREVVGIFPYSTVHVNYAVAEARTAQPKWSALPMDARVDALVRLQALIELRGADLADLIAWEVGKARWESEQEVRGAISKIDVAVKEAYRLIKPSTVDDIQGGVEWHPLGVISVVGPFNFPLLLSHGQAVAALLSGNTVVMKPSGLTPGVGQLYAELLAEAEFPRGVVNLLQGGPDVGAALVAHDDVDGVQFTGSWTAGRSILEATLDQPRKLIALEMGGKNAAVVLRDADIPRACHDVVFGAFATTGQRCTATSRLIVERAVADSVIEQVVKLAGGIRIGYPLEEDVFMGPLVSEGAVGKYLKSLARGEAEGAEPLLAGGARETGRPGSYVSPSVHRVRQRRSSSSYQRDELFGPDLAVYTVEDLDEAIEVVNDTDYGLVASLFTQDESQWKKFRRLAHVGVCHWNRSTISSSGRLPFGGVGRSGNHRPAGLYTIRSCAFPMAYLEAPESVRPPGLPES